VVPHFVIDKALPRHFIAEVFFDVHFIRFPALFRGSCERNRCDVPFNLF
jgi:hypothetical protein